MPKIYCKNCNTPTEYSDSKPKFCSGCGQPFAASLAFSPITLEIEKKQSLSAFQKALAETSALQEETEDNYQQLDINEIQIEPINIPSNRVSLKSLAFDTSKKVDIQRPKLKVTSKKKFLESFQNETKSTRRTSLPIE